MDDIDTCLVYMGIAFFLFIFIIMVIAQYSGKKKIAKIDAEGARHRTHFKCPFCEKEIKYRGEKLPFNAVCVNCRNKFMVYEGKIKLFYYRDSSGKDIFRNYNGLKTREVKQVEVDRHIEIKDSVICRSSIGADDSPLRQCER